MQFESSLLILLQKKSYCIWPGTGRLSHNNQSMQAHVE